MRTPAEIAERYRNRRDDDFLGVIAEVLLSYVPVDDVREFMKPDADLSDWKHAEPTEDAVRGLMGDYISFAWDKATGHRGISAARSIQKFTDWLWLLGDDDLLSFAEDEANFPQYGAPILSRICEKYGFEIPAGQDVKRMIEGLSCVAGCREGCGV